MAGYGISLKYLKFDTLRSMEEEYLKNPVLENKQEVNAGSDEYIKNTTEFVMQDYNLATNRYVDYKSSMPIKYLGMTIDDITEYISENADEYKEENIDVRNVMLISFSEKKVVIRRCYREIVEEETTEESDSVRYYIMEKDGYITIYKADKESIFLNTEILVATLSKEDISLVREGIGVKDIFEMYGYLESLTS
ncbi:MAG: hypothetical protein E7266_05435 [Lachnospiraceae bacterium]|nr:hypothetical protein [Lachnospiraceae bacterium]